MFPPVPGQTQCPAAPQTCCVWQACMSKEHGATSIIAYLRSARGRRDVHPLGLPPQIDLRRASDSFAAQFTARFARIVRITRTRSMTMTSQAKMHRHTKAVAAGSHLQRYFAAASLRSSMDKRMSERSGKQAGQRHRGDSLVSYIHQHAIWHHVLPMVWQAPGILCSAVTHA